MPDSEEEQAQAPDAAGEEAVEKLFDEEAGSDQGGDGGASAGDEDGSAGEDEASAEDSSEEDEEGPDEYEPVRAKGRVRRDQVWVGVRCPRARAPPA